jgi:N-acetyltransferase
LQKKDFNLQPNHLKNQLIELVPLQETDFDRLFLVASDPLVWEQHPNKNRYKKEDFKTYFDGAMQSQGAFIVLDSQTGDVVGSSRFYDLDSQNKSIKIGYTFIGIKFWGSNYNQNMKSLMINHAFETIDKVIFEIGAQNFRSQKAIAKIGATKIEEQEITYYGEDSKLNFVYQICKK